MGRIVLLLREAYKMGFRLPKIERNHILEFMFEVPQHGIIGVV